MPKLIFRDLRSDEIECRVASIKKGSGLSLLLYKDARCDMNILDETVGPFDWKREHTRENANCIVSIWDKDKNDWVSKEDTGTESNTEKEKGLASDSFKRACFNWGIGRELYTAPFIWISESGCTITDTTPPKCYDKFSVTDISIVDKKIVALTIFNNTKNQTVFKYGKSSRDLLREYCDKNGIDKKIISDACGLHRESTESDYAAALEYAKKIGEQA